MILSCHCSVVCTSTLWLRPCQRLPAALPRDWPPIQVRGRSSGKPRHWAFFSTWKFNFFPIFCRHTSDQYTSTLRERCSRLKPILKEKTAGGERLWSQLVAGEAWGRGHHWPRTQSGIHLTTDQTSEDEPRTWRSGGNVLSTEATAAGGWGRSLPAAELGWGAHILS